MQEEKRKDYDFYYGIDPGVTGAITILDRRLYTVQIFKMPDSIREIAEIICSRPLRSALAVLEQVHASPQQGVSSAFTFGRGFGQLEALVHCYFTNHVLVTPQRWQAGLDCMTRGDKKISKERAEKLFPSVPGITLKTADSLLLAYYGYWKYGQR